MIFNEKKMLEICKKYGIEVVESNGYPLDNGIEMNPDDFSFSELMSEHNESLCDVTTTIVNTQKMCISIEKTNMGDIFIGSKPICRVEVETTRGQIVSTINDNICSAA